MYTRVLNYLTLALFLASCAPRPDGTAAIFSSKRNVILDNSASDSGDMDAKPKSKKEIEKQLDEAQVTKNRYLSLFKPVLAVRDINCIGCHGRITGTDPVIMTDFSLDKDFGMFGNKADILAFKGEGGLNVAWNYQTLTINGKLIVPKKMVRNDYVIDAFVRAGSVDPMLRELSLIDALTKPLEIPPEVSTALGTNQFNRTTLISNVGFSDPGKPGVQSIEELEGLKIHTPTKADFEALAAHPELKLVQSSSGLRILRDSQAIIEGLEIRNELGVPYATNASSTIKCVGDVVIDGRIFLNNVTIQSTTEGCTLYVVDTIFIQDNLKSAPLNAGDNPRIKLAATVVSFGIKNTRFEVPGGNTIPGLLEDAGPVTVFYKLPTVDPEKEPVVGYNYNLLHTATPTHPITYVNGYSQAVDQCLRPDGNLDTARCGGRQAKGFMRKSVSYEGLIIAADVVASRYDGAIRGAIVARVAQLALDRFVFVDDPSMPIANYFKLLPFDLVSISK